MDIILIRRYVREDREKEFLEDYHAHRSDHADFIDETLTKFSSDVDLPDQLKSLFAPAPDCLNYLNIAFWRDWRSFGGQCIMKEPGYDPDIETQRRERMVFECVKPLAGSLGAGPKPE